MMTEGPAGLVGRKTGWQEDGTREPIQAAHVSAINFSARMFLQRAFWSVQSPDCRWAFGNGAKPCEPCWRVVGAGG
jgi:hypothetical protein